MAIIYIPFLNSLYVFMFCIKIDIDWKRTKNRYFWSDPTEPKKPTNAFIKFYCDQVNESGIFPHLLLRYKETEKLIFR